MKLYNNSLRKVLNKWPGKRYFGIYRFLPAFFLLGAALEFSMVNWQVGETNFYKTFKKTQARSIVESKLHEDKHPDKIS